MSENNDYILETDDSSKQIQLKEVYYNCSECKSHIEILKLNEIESTIEFRCINNNHKIKMKIKEYLDKMKNFNDKNINSDKCLNKDHKNNYYECYCLKCNQHLCKECLLTRMHKEHNKINILEVKPNKDELNIIEDIIKYYEDEFDKLDKESLNKTKYIYNKLKDYKIKLEQRKEIKLKENEDNIKKELELNNNKYKLDIENIRSKYENEIKLLKYNYGKNINEIMNKYKGINGYNNAIYKNEIKNLDNRYIKIK
jgi:DNA-directed RNA polymerase subunit RPC12/RpoP